MVAVNGHSNPTLSDLHGEIERLGQLRLELAARLADAADRLEVSGDAPSSLLVDDLRSYRQRVITLFSVLGGNIENSDAEISFNELSRLLDAHDYRQITAVVMDQLSGLFHVDIPDFAPLALCQQEALRLSELAHEPVDFAPDSELELLRSKRHPLNALIRLCHECEQLSDNEWTQCHDDVAATYGRLLATALTRGRIQRKPSVKPAPEDPPLSARPPVLVEVEDQTRKSDLPQVATDEGNASRSGSTDSRSIFELEPAVTSIFDLTPAEPKSGTRLQEETPPLQLPRSHINSFVETPRSAGGRTTSTAAAVSSVRTVEEIHTKPIAPTVSSKTASEHLIQLIADGRLPLALHLARCLSLRSGTHNPVPPWLLRALILGRNLSYSKGEIARQLDEELREFRADLLLDGGDEHRLAMSFLLRSAALPAALLTGSAPALAILRSFKIEPGFSQLYNYCSRIALYGDRLSGSLVEMFRPSGAIAGATELEEVSLSARTWLHEVARKAVSYSRSSPLFLHAHWTLTAGTAIRHAEACVLWCKWQETLSLAQNLLKPVCELADGERNWVRQEISRLTTQVRVEPAEQPFRSSGQPHQGSRGIILPSEEMHAVILEAVALANRWLRLSHQASAAHSSPIPLEALELRDEIIKRSESVLTEMAQHRQSGTSPLVNASIACCQATVRHIQALFESRISLPLVEPDPRQILNIDLLKIPGIDLDDQWQPESDPTVIERELLASLEQPELTWRQCYDLHAREGNHEATGRLLDLDVWATPEERDSLRAHRDARVQECRAGLSADLDELSSDLATIAESGAWTESALTSFRTRLNRLRADLPRALNFSFLGRQVSQLQAAILKQSNSSWVPSALTGWPTTPGLVATNREQATADAAIHSCDIFSGE